MHVTNFVDNSQCRRDDEIEVSTVHCAMYECRKKRWKKIILYNSVSHSRMRYAFAGIPPMGTFL